MSPSGTLVKRLVRASETEQNSSQFAGTETGQGATVESSENISDRGRDEEMGRFRDRPIRRETQACVDKYTYTNADADADERAERRALRRKPN